MKNYNYNKKKVLDTISKYPESKDALKELFPEYFLDNAMFCEIGIILIRDEYPNCFYALFKWNGTIRLLNVTNNQFFKNDGERELRESDLFHEKKMSVTNSEFKQLIGNASIDSFKVIRREHISVSK